MLWTRLVYQYSDSSVCKALLDAVKAPGHCCVGEVGRAEQGAAHIRQDLQLVPPVLLALPVSMALRCWQAALCRPFSTFDTISEGQTAVGTQMHAS